MRIKINLRLSKRSPDGVDRTGQELKFNEDFQLKCIDDDEINGRSFVLFSSSKTSGLRNMSTYPVVSYKNGEVNQTVGVCLQNRPIKEGCLPTIPPAHFNWRCLHRLPNQRYESEGEPVPVIDILNLYNNHRFILVITICLYIE